MQSHVGTYKEEPSFNPEQHWVGRLGFMENGPPGARLSYPEGKLKVRGDVGADSFELNQWNEQTSLFYSAFSKNSLKI